MATVSSQPSNGPLLRERRFAPFDTPFEVRTSEPAIELLFPADQATAKALRPRSDQGGAG
jgi:hypothetical protein